jgi:hypothetical protein
MTTYFNILYPSNIQTQEGRKIANKILKADFMSEEDEDRIRNLAMDQYLFYDLERFSKRFIEGMKTHFKGSFMLSCNAKIVAKTYIMYQIQVQPLPTFQ